MFGKKQITHQKQGIILLLSLGLTLSVSVMADGGVYSAYDTNSDGYLNKLEFRA